MKTFKKSIKTILLLYSSTKKPIECPHCKLCLWSDNLQSHYDIFDQTRIAPIKDTQEIIRLQNLKK